MYHANDKKTSWYLVPAVQIYRISVRIPVYGTVEMFCRNIDISVSGTVQM